MVGRVWPRHGGGGRPLNSVVSLHVGYADAFAKYGAKLTNPQWSVSAFGTGGCLVLSLWQNYLKRGELKG